MKTKVALIIVILIALALGAALITRNKQAADEHKKDLDLITLHSNQLVETTSKLDEQKQVNISLEKDMTARKAEVTQLSNDLSQTTEKLNKTEADLKSAMEEAAKRDAKIAELESQKEALDKQAVDLRGSIGQLETKITDTQKKLAASEGDKAFLEKELQRLMAEKAELERQFNDLAVLRAQVHKLKEELSVARRLDWIRQGLFASQDEKGATKLMQSSISGTSRPATANDNYNLNVEVNADGSVRVIPPVTNTASGTNVAPTNAPPK
jgi:chromosome segregation ATPase